MVKIVESQWVADRIGKPGFTIVDARRPMKYLMGHLPAAIDIPAYKAFGADGRLSAADTLAEFIGGAGLGDSSSPILYDSPEGQNAAMLAWILEYLGRTDVHVMDGFFESWKADGREVLYKPVEAAAERFTAKVNPTIRATLDEVRGGRAFKLVDFRSHEEFAGERSMADDAPGHIPGAVNIVWREIANLPEGILKSNDQIERLLMDASIARGDKIVAYCRSGPRAALGYLALRQLGYDVRLFDGSYAEWTKASQPAEK